MDNPLMAALKVVGVPAELAADHPTKDPSAVKRRAILVGGAGFMVPFVAGLPFIVNGVIPVTWGEWLFALSVVLAVWSLMWCILLLGWDKRLRFDPHFLLVPAAASATLLWLFIYLFPEVRLVFLQGWFVVLLVGAGLFSLKEVLAVSAFMAGGYLGTIGILVARGERISWRFEIAMVILPFILFTFFCGTVLERLRRERVEMKALRKQLSHLALTDELTDLANRRHFDDYLQSHAALSRRSGATYAVGLIDIDHFKEINDSMGHEVGDRVLVELAQIVRGHLRQSDLAARLGGDEFAVLMPGTNAAEAGVVLSRILRAVAEHRFSGSGLRTGQVTVSMGATDSGGEEAPDEVLRRADAELYSAKHDGRNRVAVFAPRHFSSLQAREDPTLS